MDTRPLLGLIGVLGLAGCTLTAGGPAYEAQADTTATVGIAATAQAAAAPAASTVTLSGQVVDTSGAGVAGTQVLCLPDDAYLNSILRAETANSGAFTLAGVAADARQWFYFQQSGYAGRFDALDTTPDPRQATSPVTLLSNAEAATMAQSFGVTLDPDKSVVRVPVTVGAGAQGSTPASDLQVSFEPPLDVPVHYVDGEAIAFNVVPYESYQVTVTHGGHLCAPASHPSLVANDGSVEVRLMAGSWTVAPTMACP